MFNKGHLNETELKPMTRKIELQAGNVSLLIENILLLVKSQLNGITINMESFNLADWVNGHFSLYHLQASEKEIEIKSSIHEGLLVRADKNVVSLVIRNLIANAIKYSNRNSRIEISARETGATVTLSVIDSGQGMTDSQVQFIFQKSTSIRSMSGTEKETGVGLGLRLCRDYLFLMGTDFEIKSSPGLGTTVSISMQRG
jgi:signal transduction histidine kinase